MRREAVVFVIRKGDNYFVVKREAEAEYYDKQFPLDVAKKMLEEERKKFYDKLFENG